MTLNHGRNSAKGRTRDDDYEGVQGLLTDVLSWDVDRPSGRALSGELSSMGTRRSVPSHHLGLHTYLGRLRQVAYLVISWPTFGIDFLTRPS